MAAFKTETPYLPPESAFFDLYGSPKGDAAEQVLRVQRELAVLQPPTDSIGHNSSAFFPLTEDERRDLDAELRSVGEEVTAPSPDKDRLSESVRKFVAYAAKVAVWVAGKLDKSAEAAAEEWGKSLADYKVWVAGWLFFSGHLDSLVVAISSLLQKLI